MKYVVMAGMNEILYGPFDSIKAAERWAVASFTMCAWKIVPIKQVK